MAPWTRPSDLHRALACPASVALPKVREPAGEKSDSAKWGNEVHSWKEGQPPTKRVEKWARESGVSRLTIEELWPGGTHEVVCVMPAEGPGMYLTGLSVDERRTLRAGLGPTDLWGLADWIGEPPDHPYLHIDDLKTGRRTRWDTGEVLCPTDPRTTPQVLVEGLYKVRDTGATGAVLSITSWPRYPKGTRPERWAEWVSGSYLRDWEAGVLIPARRLALGPDAVSMVVPGPHCTFCRCMTCPEHPSTKVPDVSGADHPNP